MKLRIKKSWQRERKSPMKFMWEQPKVGSGLIGLTHSLVFEWRLDQDHGAWQWHLETVERLPGWKYLIINRLFWASFVWADAKAHCSAVHMTPKYNAVQPLRLPHILREPSLERQPCSSQGTEGYLGSDALGSLLDPCLAVAGFAPAEVSTVPLCPFPVLILTSICQIPKLCPK